MSSNYSKFLYRKESNLDLPSNSLPISVGKGHVIAFYFKGATEVEVDFEISLDNRHWFPIVTLVCSKEKPMDLVSDRNIPIQWYKLSLDGNKEGQAIYQQKDWPCEFVRVRKYKFDGEFLECDFLEETAG